MRTLTHSILSDSERLRRVYSNENFGKRIVGGMQCNRRVPYVLLVYITLFITFNDRITILTL